MNIIENDTPTSIKANNEDAPSDQEDSYDLSEPDLTHEKDQIMEILRDHLT